MAEAVVRPISVGRHLKGTSQGLFLLVAWRNLWRNKRRTYLTASATGVAMLLMQFMMSIQFGSYGPMIDVATRTSSGHIQVQHARFKDEPRIEYLVNGASALEQTLAAATDVRTVAPRAEAFALLSNEERSFGGLIVGVDPSRESQFSTLPENVTEGTYLPEPDSAAVGAGMARNLNLAIGDELIALGTNETGGIAAMVFIVAGIFDSGTPMDRLLVYVPLTTFQSMFGLTDAVHRLVLMVNDPEDLERELEQVRNAVPDGLQIYDWRELMPEISHGIEMDKIGNSFIYGVLVVIIILSIANSFVLLLFERTREFGMLFAVGMQRGAVFRMLLVEATLIWLLGIGIGYVLCALVLIPAALYGIPIPGAEELSGQMYMPERLFPTYEPFVALFAPVVLGVGSVASAGFASIRLYRLQVIEALHDEE